MNEDLQKELLEALESCVGMMRNLSSYHSCYVDRMVEEFLKDVEIEALIERAKAVLE